MMNWGNGGMTGWGFALMSFSTVLFWALLIAGIVLLARYLGDHRPMTLEQPSRQSAAEQILAERLARGEIEEDDYRRRLAALRGQAGPESSKEIHSRR